MTRPKTPAAITRFVRDSQTSATLMIAKTDRGLWATTGHWLAPAELLAPALEHWNLPADEEAVYSVAATISRSSWVGDSWKSQIQGYVSAPFSGELRPHLVAKAFTRYGQHKARAEISTPSGYAMAFDRVLADPLPLGAENPMVFVRTAFIEFILGTLDTEIVARQESAKKPIGFFDDGSLIGLAMGIRLW